MLDGNVWGPIVWPPSVSARERRGSRARCLLLTHGPAEIVAARLARLAAPYARINPARHRWMPRGLDGPAEAELDKAGLLSSHKQSLLRQWWLALPKLARTPNWDIACAATIGGVE